MSVEELIHQTIKHGNVFEAIEYNIFGYQELIDYLAKNVEKIQIEKLRLSYCALLRYYPPSYHYSYGKHLLTCFPKDDFIMRAYCLLGGSPELPSNKDEPSNTLWSLIFDTYSEFISEAWNEDIEKIMLLCNKITVKLAKKEFLFRQDKEFISQLFAYRCDKVIGMLPLCGIRSKTLKNYYIETDWFDQYPSILKSYNFYIQHCDHVRINAPLYYQKLLDQFQTQLSQLTLEEFEKLELPLLKLTRQCFPTQFSNAEVDDQYIKLTIYPLTVRAYVLGFPCYPKLPQAHEIDDAIFKLTKLGPEEYVETVLNKNSYPESRIANIEDTLFENPENYSPLDRFDIEENGKIYRFTRPEFAKLYQDKSNFWTKSKLSYSDIYSLNIRINMCKVLNLPSSDTLIVLLEKACKGTLFQTFEAPKPVVSQNPLQSLSPQNLIHLFQNVFHLSNESILQALSGAQGISQADQYNQQIQIPEPVHETVPIHEPVPEPVHEPVPEPLLENLEGLESDEEVEIQDSQ